MKLRTLLAIAIGLSAGTLAWIVRCPCSTCGCGIACGCPRYWSPWVEILTATLAVTVLLLLSSRHRFRAGRRIPST